VPGTQRALRVARASRAALAPIGRHGLLRHQAQALAVSACSSRAPFYGRPATDAAAFASASDLLRTPTRACRACRQVRVVAWQSARASARSQSSRPPRPVAPGRTDAHGSREGAGERVDRRSDDEVVLAQPGFREAIASRPARRVSMEEAPPAERLRPARARGPDARRCPVAPRSSTACQYFCSASRAFRTGSGTTPAATATSKAPCESNWPVERTSIRYRAPSTE
jgi:hypothetical protein